MDKTYGTHSDDEYFDIHDYLTIMMMLIMILTMILMMMLMMVGAGTEDRFQEEPYTFPSTHTQSLLGLPPRGKGCVQSSRIWIPSGTGKGRE